MEREIDVLWVLVSAGLVFLMQAGFLCLEAGLTRSKNNINTAMKVLADCSVTVFLFWLFGFALMFGVTSGGWIGTTNFVLDYQQGGAPLFAFFIFQVMFAAAAVTILSGAIAERARFSGFLLMAAVAAGIIYPVFGHWAWNGGLAGTPSGWLGARGFVDFAGSSVVHSVGGWISLAALLILGTRSGRFAPDGTPRKIPGANLPLATLGVFILWFGWFGFNGGSTLAMTDHVPRIILNTALAGAAGMLSSLLVGWPVRKQADVGLLINGTLAGTVAITANAHAVSLLSAAVIGAVGGLVALLVEGWLEKLRIDDAVGAVPVHLGAGIWGTLAVGIFGDPELLGTGLDRGGQILAQVVGIIVCAIWAFGVMYIALWIINRIFPLRVDPGAESIGLNVSQHGATTELLEMFTVMDQQARTGDVSLRVPEEPFTEIGQIAKNYNRVIDALELATARTEAIVRSSIDGIITFSKGALTITSINPAARRMFGYIGDELLGEPLTVLLGTDEGGGVVLEPQQVDAILSKRVSTSPNFEMIGRRTDGSTFPMEVVVTEARVGEEAFYTGTFRAVSQSAPAQSG
jgi:Amt family ammonium transporter